MNRQLTEKIERGWAVRQENFPPEIHFDYPLDTALISLSGDRCALDCAHCGGVYLRHMRPIWEVDALEAPSCLISGGCDPAGRVAVTTYLDRVAAIREGRRMNWHVGFIGREEIETIAPYVDVVSFDFVGDVETAHEVYGLTKTPQDYVDTYRLLCEYVRVVPHLTIGLRGGEISGEYEALRLLAQLDVERLVFLVLIPTPGTRYADRQPPAVEAVADVIAEARLMFPQTPLNLGCMRPHGTYRAQLDVLAVQCGLNHIVSPARDAVRLAERLGLTIARTRECCAL